MMRNKAEDKSLDMFPLSEVHVQTVPFGLDSVIHQAKFFKLKELFVIDESKFISKSIMYDLSEALKFGGDKAGFIAGVTKAKTEISLLLQNAPEDKKLLGFVNLEKTGSYEAFLKLDPTATLYHYLYFMEASNFVISYSITSFMNGVLPVLIMHQFLADFAAEYESKKEDPLFKNHVDAFLEAYDTIYRKLDIQAKLYECVAIIWKCAAKLDPEARLALFGYFFNSPAFYAMYFGANNIGGTHLATMDHLYKETLQNTVVLLHEKGLLKYSPSLEKFLIHHRFLKATSPLWDRPSTPAQKLTLPPQDSRSYGAIFYDYHAELENVLESPLLEISLTYLPPIEANQRAINVEMHDTLHYWKLGANLAQDFIAFTQDILKPFKKTPLKNLKFQYICSSDPKYHITIQQALKENPKLIQGEFLTERKHVMKFASFHAFLGVYVPLFLLKNYLLKAESTDGATPENIFDAHHVEGFLKQITAIAVFLKKLDRELIVDPLPFWFILEAMPLADKFRFANALFQSESFCDMIRQDVMSIHSVHHHGGLRAYIENLVDTMANAGRLEKSAYFVKIAELLRLKIPMSMMLATLPSSQEVVTYHPGIHPFLKSAEMLSAAEKTALNQHYFDCFMTKRSVKANKFFDIIMTHANPKLAPAFLEHAIKSDNVLFSAFQKYHDEYLKKQAPAILKTVSPAPSTSKDKGKQKAEVLSAPPDDAARLKKEAEETKKAEDKKRKQEEKSLKKEQEELLKTQKKQAEEAQKAAEKAAKDKALTDAKAKKDAEKQAKAQEKQKAAEASTSGTPAASALNKGLLDTATKLGRKIVDKFTPDGVRKKVEKAVYSHATQMFFKLGRPLQLNHATGSVTSLSTHQAPPSRPIPFVADASSWPLPQASRAEVVSPVVSPKLAPPVKMQPTLAEPAPLAEAPHQATPETPWQAPDNALEILFNLLEKGADKEAIHDITEHDNACSDLFNGLASASFETLERYSARISQFFESDKVRHSWKSRLWEALLVQCDTPAGCYLAALICKQNGFYDLANIYYHLAGGKHYHKGQQDLKALCLPADSIAMGFETTNRKATQAFLDALLLGYGDRLKGMRVALTAANQSRALHPHDYLHCLNIYVVYLIKMLRTGAFEVGQYTHLYPAFAHNRDGLLQTCKECVDDIFMNLGHNQTILTQYAEPAWILFQNLNILSQDVYGQNEPDLFLYNGLMENVYYDQGQFFRNMSTIAASTEVNGDAHAFGSLLERNMQARKYTH